MKPSHQRFVDVGATGGSQDREAAIFLGPPQHILDFNAGMAVVAMFHISAFPKKSIRFVEKQSHPILFRQIKDTVEILFCLANVIGDYAIQIDPVQVLFKVACQGLNGEKAPRPIFAGQ
jgi:hypothetical protein